MTKSRSVLRLFVFVLSIGIVAGASALTGEKKAKLDYKLVADWPQLPEGMKLGGISAVASDSKDNVYVLHRIKPHVLVFGSDGKFLRSWSADFKTPHGLRIDADDNLWIADMANHIVQKFKSDGTLLLKLGQKDRPGLGEEQFNKPADAAVGAGGDIYVADGYGNSRIAQFDKTGKFLRDWGKKGKGAAEFNIPHVVVCDDKERVIVGDRENARVQIFDRAGKFLEQWPDTGAPYGLCLAKDRVFLADGKTGTIRVLDRSGKLLHRWDTGDAKNTPHWISTDRKGAVYIGFVSGNKVEKWALKS
jgi:DNA-binding beta-propeller fold protein YncE